MRKWLQAGILVLGLHAAAIAQVKQDSQQKQEIDSSYANGYYVERMRFFTRLQPSSANLVAFVGNSITEAGPWQEILPGVNVINRGISGDNSWGVLARIDAVLALKPAKIFLMIGVNDLKRGTPVEYITNNYKRIVTRIQQSQPQTKVYLQSVLPIAEQGIAAIYQKISNRLITTLNDSLQQIAVRYHCEFLNLNKEVFAGADGQLKRELTTDGLHLKHTGYLEWAAYLTGKGHVGSTPAPKSNQIDSSYNNTYYQGRMELFNNLPVVKNGIVFLGNSITERGPWWELLPGEIVLNRGIGGDNTFGVLARLEGVAKTQPRKLFLLIGINDLSRGLPIPVILNNYRRILTYLRQNTAGTKIYVQSVLPLNEAVTQAAYLKNKKDSIIILNRGIRQIATEFGLPYINLHPLFADNNGDLKKELTADGIHLRPPAYLLWVEYLRKNKYL